MHRHSWGNAKALCRKCVFNNGRGCRVGNIMAECEMVLYSLWPQLFCKECAYWQNNECALGLEREECVFWERFLTRQDWCLGREEDADSKRRVFA